MVHFKENVSRERDGRYQVRLPRKNTNYELGNSLRQATQRYQSNKCSLSKWSEFAEAVREYVNLGNAELVPELDLLKPDCITFYLPMHGVSKSSSTTTKLRVVFDASARTTSGHSLNDLLLTSPSTYPLLVNILLHFHLAKIGVSADISKMFREISLHPDERDFRCFISKMMMEIFNTGEWSDSLLVSHALPSLLPRY